jgi:hypothetical protein
MVRTFGHLATEALYSAKSEASKGKPLRHDDMVKLLNDVHDKHCPACQTQPLPARSKQPEASGLLEYSPEVLEALRVKIGSWRQFNRRPTTKWNEKELKKLKSLFPIDPADIATVEAWYNHPDPDFRKFCRNDIETLLNNFAGERDRAQRKITPAAPAAKDYSKI